MPICVLPYVPCRCVHCMVCQSCSSNTSSLALKKVSRHSFFYFCLFLCVLMCERALSRVHGVVKEVIGWSINIMFLCPPRHICVLVSVWCIISDSLSASWPCACLLDCVCVCVFLQACQPHNWSLDKPCGPRSLFCNCQAKTLVLNWPTLARAVFLMVLFLPARLLLHLLLLMSFAQNLSDYNRNQSNTFSFNPSPYSALCNGPS